MDNIKITNFDEAQKWVVDLVCKSYCLSPEDIRTKRSAHPRPTARQIIEYILCTEFAYTLSQVAVLFRKGDHSVVHYSLRMVQNMIATRDRHTIHLNNVLEEVCKFTRRVPVFEPIPYSELHSKSLVIAVDFDGTIVEEKFPEIGDEIPEAFYSLKFFKDKGHKLILYTCRSGKYLDAAIKFMEYKGIKFDAINKSISAYPGFKPAKPKVWADIYIDDKSNFGFPGWIQTRNYVLQKSLEIK